MSNSFWDFEVAAETAGAPKKRPGRFEVQILYQITGVPLTVAARRSKLSEPDLGNSQKETGGFGRPPEAGLSPGSWLRQAERPNGSAAQLSSRRRRG